MYGMLLESVAHFVQLEYGEEIWQQIMAEAKCKFTVFNTHHIYPDNLISDLAAACSVVTGEGTSDDFMRFFGRCFVRFFSNFGYDTAIRATGRYFTDFLQNVDNIHLQMRFTYPKMKSPSMYITHVDKEGVVLVYRSTREGFIQYFMGQLFQIAQELYETEVNVNVVEEKTTAQPGGKINVLVKFRLDFDNREFMASRASKKTSLERIALPPIPCSILLRLFQFGIVLDKDMKIIAVGEKLIQIYERDILGRQVEDLFKLRRPRGITFNWSNTLHMESVFFELEIIRPTNPQDDAEDAANGAANGTANGAATGPGASTDDATTPEANANPSSHNTDRRGSQGNRSILLKGQMKYLEDIKAIIFLCSPLINNLEEFPHLGLYLNDLNPHGLSREMVLAGWQHCSRLELMFERAESHSDELEQSYTLLDRWKRRGDDLLYSMIPQSVAEKLRAGESPMSTCQTFDAVSVLFCELCDHAGSATTKQDVMDVVTRMNAVFSCFDALMDRFNVYKVETVGQVYMAVSGAPEYTPNHAQNTADVSLCLLRQVKNLKLPSGMDIQVRIGIHSGPVVAGIVGMKVPRYCLFGDTVNTAARMQTTSTPGNLHVSHATRDLLQDDRYNIESRGIVTVKGKGEMETYWISDRVGVIHEEDTN